MGSEEPQQAKAQYHGNQELRDKALKVLQTDVSKLPLEERCQMVCYFRDTLVREGKKDGFCNLEKKYINSGAFWMEIHALNKLLDTLAYSQYLKSWLFSRRQEYTTAIRFGQPWKTLCEAWKRKSLVERVQNVSLNLRAQCNVYSKGAMDFFPSSVKTFQDPKKKLVAYVSAAASVLNEWTPPDINIREDIMMADSPIDAYQAAHHEQIHAMLSQLAMAFNRGMLPESHLFYQDARMQHARGKCEAYMPSFLQENYNHDPEEVLCAEQDGKFIAAYMAPLF